MAYSAATAGDAPMPTPTPQRTRKRILKPHERRALVLLAGRGAAGCTKAVMLLHGFTAEQLTNWSVPDSPTRPSSARSVVRKPCGRSAKRVGGRSTANDDRNAREARRQI